MKNIIIFSFLFMGTCFSMEINETETTTVSLVPTSIKKFHKEWFDEYWQIFMNCTPPTCLDQKIESFGKAWVTFEGKYNLYMEIYRKITEVKDYLSNNNLSGNDLDKLGDYFILDKNVFYNYILNINEMYPDDEPTLFKEFEILQNQVLKTAHDVPVILNCINMILKNQENVINMLFSKAKELMCSIWSEQNDKKEAQDVSPTLACEDGIKRNHYNSMLKRTL